jgi:MarR family transcriptional regulator, transcriptional regulator for hemolysin
MQHIKSQLRPGPDRQAFLEQQPTYWLKRCYQALRRNVDGALREYGLTLSQRDVLLTLYEEGPLDQSALTERLGLEQSSVSRLVEGLARRDFVQLRTDPDDRRVRIAVLSPQGGESLLRTPGSSQLGSELMLKGLNTHERRELVRLLKHCSENLLKENVNRGTENARSHAGNGR